jgi:hypothetical protein
MLRTCTVTIAAMTLVAALVLVTEVWAGGTIQVGGKMTCKTPERQSIPVEGKSGSRSRCSN